MLDKSVILKGKNKSWKEITSISLPVGDENVLFLGMVDF